MNNLPLPKRKSVKTYLNYLPIDIIHIINEKIPSEKKYKDKIKNKKKINEQIKLGIGYWKIISDDNDNDFFSDLFG